MNPIQKAFIPDKRNLGGKRDIDLHKQNHLLALMNMKSQLNSMQSPHQHVNISHKSNKKLLLHDDEFKEVHEAFKRVKSLKGCALDNKLPITYDRKGYIKNRIPQVKDIGFQDHQRNIKSLLNRIDLQEKNHEKKVNKIKQLGQKNGSERKNSYFSNQRSGVYPIDIMQDYNKSQSLLKGSEIPVSPPENFDNFPLVMDYSEAQMYSHNLQPNYEDYDQEFDQEYYEDSQYIPQNQQQMKQEKQIQKRPSTAQTRKKQDEINGNLKVGHSQDQYKDLRRILLNVVMDSNMFDKGQIMELAVQAKKANPALDKQKISDICKQIVISLYGDL